jgi:hypothetical protein
MVLDLKKKTDLKVVGNNRGQELYLLLRSVIGKDKAATTIYT